MVDLPKIDNVVALARAPQPAVSPADIRAPFQQLASNLEKAGEVLDKDIAQPAAEIAGQQAVRQGPDGMPIVDRAPIFGPASIVFGRAARSTELAQLQPKIEDKMTELRLQFPNNPKGFQDAANGYGKQLIENTPDPLLHGPLLKTVADSASQNYRTSLVQTDHINQQNNLEALQSRLSTLNNRGASLADQGGTDTPEYAQLHAERAAIYKELAADPRNKYPAARVENELKASRDEDVIQGVIGEVSRDFKTKKNLPQAQRALQEAFWGEGSERFNLTPTQRNKGVSEGLKRLERTSVEDSAAVKAFRSGTTDYIENIQKNPNSFDEIRHNNLEAQARTIGDSESLLRLNALREFAPLASAFKSLPPAEANHAMSSIARGVVPALPVRLADRDMQGKIEAEAARQGVPPQLAVAAAAIESRGNPNAVSPGGGYKGIFQLSPDEFAAGGGTGSIFDPDQNIRSGIASLKRKSDAFEKEFGKPPSATEVYLMHQQGEAGARAHLANPDLPAWVNMANTGEGRSKGSKAEAWAKAAIWGNLPPSAQQQFGSVENVTSRDFVGVWQQRVQGIPYGGSSLRAGDTEIGLAARNPYMFKMWEDGIKSMREHLGKSATTLADQITKQADAGDPVNPDSFRTFVASAISSGKEELFDKVRPALAAQDKRAQVREGGPGAIAALDSQITALKASGAPPVEYETLKTLQAGIEQDAKTWKTDPLSIGVATKLVDPIHQIDPANPQAATQEFGAREAKLKILQGSGRGVGPASALTENEGETLKTALVQGDPQAAGGILQGMASSLSPDNFKATMATPPMKEALSGMIRSRDPARMTTGMSTLDRLWRGDGWGFGDTYGEGTLNHLQAWQGMKDSFNSQEIAERLNVSDDPTAIRARKDLKESAATEMKEIKPGDIGNLLGTWSDRWLPFVNQTLPPTTFDVDGQGPLSLRHDFEQAYSTLRSLGTEPDQAKKLAAERIKKMWGPSPTAGQLMKYPPEAYYDDVNGSHAWLADDLQSLVARIKGPQVDAGATGDPMGATIPRVNWTVQGLVADARTQAEIGAHAPPAYKIALRDRNGSIEFLTDRDGTNRFRFDRSGFLADAKKRFQERHDAMNELFNLERDRTGEVP